MFPTRDGWISLACHDTARANVLLALAGHPEAMLVNAAAARFLGKSPEEIVGRHDLELYSEETARRFIDDDRKVLATGQAHSFEGVATGEGVVMPSERVTSPALQVAQAALPGGAPLRRNLLLIEESVASCLLPAAGTPFADPTQPSYDPDATAPLTQRVLEFLALHG